MQVSPSGGIAYFTLSTTDVHDPYPLHGGTWPRGMKDVPAPSRMWKSCQDARARCGQDSLSWLVCGGTATGVFLPPSRRSEEVMAVVRLHMLHDAEDGLHTVGAR